MPRPLVHLISLHLPLLAYTYPHLSATTQKHTSAFKGMNYRLEEIEQIQLLEGEVAFGRGGGIPVSSRSDLIVTEIELRS